MQMAALKLEAAAAKSKGRMTEYRTHVRGPGTQAVEACATRSPVASLLRKGPVGRAL